MPAPLCFPRGPLSRGEFAVLVLLFVVQTVIAAGLDIDTHETSSEGGRWVAELLELVVGVCSFLGSLALLRVRREFLLPTALWGMLSWFGLYLSRLAYIGFLLLPLEVVVAAVAVSSRAGCGMKKAWVAALIGRGATLGAHAALVHLLHA